jgi:16S rRNA (guanine1516-N2)-methyltransferase
MSQLVSNDSRQLIAVLCDDNPASGCSALANALEIPLISQEALTGDDYSFTLQYLDGSLALQAMDKPAPGPVIVDFVSGAANYRRNKGGGELIVKAIGGSQSNRPSVFDATAGLGRDSFVLASAGCKVTLFERSPIVAALLRDGLERLTASENEDSRQIAADIQFNSMDSISYLSTVEQGERPDVVYIDPMFPPSKKSALVKKEMRAFHQLVGADQDSSELLGAALEAAIHRVVVKRPLKADYIAEKKPNYSLSGKTIRFDIYALKAFK